MKGHVFISYAREDSPHVDRMQRELEAHGARVWRDTFDLWPGEDWRAKIRRAITDNALAFIACFSRASLARSRSYQNEELMLAIEQLRLRRPDEPWLIPVRFDDVEIPDWDIGAGRTLRSIQHADLFGDRFDDGAARLVAAVLRILGEQSDSEGGTLPTDDDNREVKSFLENLQIYLSHLGSLDALLALLPEGIWPIIGASARMVADEFIQTHGLRERFPMLDEPDRLRTGIEWQLQTSWIRGYVMYKFYVFDHVPAPSRPIDPKAIMASVAVPDVQEYPLLAATIPVFLQRAASLSTAPDLVAARLQGFNESITRILVEQLDDWCASEREAYGWGIFFAKAEHDFYRRLVRTSC